MAYITLNKNNFFNNLDIIADKTKDKDKIAIVLKDNAYGHGLCLMADMAKEYGIKLAVVRTYDEAQEIKSYFEYILVLADIPQEYDEKIRYTINDITMIDNFPSGTKVELKVDTLMHRNGVSMDELEVAIKKIQKQALVLEGIFTHHRSADELTSEWFVQNENFKIIKQKVKDLGLNDIRFHSANSASLMRTQNFDEDMVRVGIAAYGCLDDNEDIKAVLSLHAKKNSTRDIKVGQRIGYGATYKFDEDVIVSNYDFGYADGFMRILSNNYTTPNNEKLVGRISMDNSSFISTKDEILIFDDARDVAKNANTISYEILTSLKPHLKREIV